MSNIDQQEQKRGQEEGRGSTTQDIEGQPSRERELMRLNPLLLRIHADDQDKKTLCLFWTAFIAFALMIAILGNFAVPELYVKQAKNLQTANGGNCSFPSSPTKKDLLLVCDSYFNTGQIGETILGWSPSNQFALTYLQIVPVSLRTALTFKTDLNITIFKIRPYFNQQINQSVIQVLQTVASTSQTLQFDSSSADPLYAKDGKSIIGYNNLIAIISHLDDYPFFISIKFNNTLNTSLISAMYSQSFAISRQFTNYTIVLRYVFFALSIGALVLYYIRYAKIPKQKRTTEQFLVAIASILLLMFNDPFYPITVLKPNGASIFFSTLFIVNMIVFLFFIWIVTADRINEEDGKIQTEQITKKKIAYTAVIWLELLVAMMVYSMQQINTAPILSSNFQATFIAAKVIIICSFLASIIYIGYRYVQICKMEQDKLWRSNIFMVISSVFIFLIFIIVAANQLIPYNYSGSTVLLVYGLVNLYVYYLQYMFTITKEEAEKLEKNDFAGEDGHEVLTVGSIDVVDVDLKNYGNSKYEYAGVKLQQDQKTEKPGYEESSGLPIKEKHQAIEEFDLE